jgi:hypothetical protein
MREAPAFFRGKTLNPRRAVAHRLRYDRSKAADGWPGLRLGAVQDEAEHRQVRQAILAGRERPHAGGQADRRADGDAEPRRGGRPEARRGSD